MAGKRTINLPLIFAVLELFIILYLFYQVYNYSILLYDTSQKLSSTREQLANLQSDYYELNSLYNIILTKLSKTQYSLSTCQTSLDQYKERYQELKNLEENEYNLLSDCKDVSLYLLDWIGENNHLTSSQWNRYVEPCVEGRTVNLPCVEWYNNFQYKEDIGDHLESIAEFLQNNGGDCEDHSLFMAAVVRTAAQRNYYVRIAKNGTGKFFLRGNWYYPNAEPVDVLPKDAYVYCGVEPDENVGHCIIVIEDRGGRRYYVESQDGFLYDGDPFKKRELIMTGDDFQRLDENRDLRTVLSQMEELERYRSFLR